jgi:hypothetical protein
LTEYSELLLDLKPDFHELPWPGLRLHQEPIVGKVRNLLVHPRSNVRKSGGQITPDPGPRDWIVKIVLGQDIARLRALWEEEVKQVATMDNERFEQGEIYMARREKPRAQPDSRRPEHLDFVDQMPRCR